MAKPVEYNATLVERVDLTPALSIFSIRPDEPLEGDPIFLPGQYTTIGLNNEEKPELGSVRRPMSIASAPESGSQLDFYIRWVKYPESDNPLTHLLWKTRAGDRIYMRTKAVGKFTMEDTVTARDPRMRVTVAAGTGLAPFLSMVRSVVSKDPKADLSRWAILHGASYPDDLGFREELEQMASENSLHYFCSISRPKEASDWTGDTGRAEDFFLPERLSELDERLGLGPEGLNPENVVIFICGLQGTIGQTIIRLAPRGFVPETRKLRRALEIPDEVESSLFFEQYDTTPVIPLDDDDLMATLRAQIRTAVYSG